MKKMITLGVSSFVLWSCTPSAPETTAVAPTESHTAPTPDAPPELIALNEGQKWKVKDDMSPYILKGEQLVDDYVRQSKTDYKALAQDVDAQNEQLIQNCSMEGASHDALHQWVQPHLELVEKLQEEKDPAAAQATVLELQQSYKRYHQSFQ